MEDDDPFHERLSPGPAFAISCPPPSMPFSRARNLGFQIGGGLPQVAVQGERRPSLATDPERVGILAINN